MNQQLPVEELQACGWWRRGNEIHTPLSNGNDRVKKGMLYYISEASELIMIMKKKKRINLQRCLSQSAYPDFKVTKKYIYK